VLGASEAFVTESESIFEDLCHRLGYSFERIAEGSEKRPDYRLHTPAGDLICEIKQFEPNAEEKAAMRARREKGEVRAIDKTPGSRVRNAISSALPQLKALTKGTLPGVVIVYDTMICEHGGAYNIRVAMYGFDAIVIGVPRDPKVWPFVKDRKSSGNRRMTEEHSTSISAVAALRYRHTGPPELDVYHNRFAAVPLSIRALTGEGVRHYRLREKAPGRFDDWEQFGSA
jgi:hypothetical protein